MKGRGVRALQAECNQHLQQALSNGQAAQTAERRCAELVALLRRVVEAHTGHNADGCDMRNAEIEHITTLTGDDRHAG
jgi:hypothetical protein